MKEKEDEEVVEGSRGSRSDPWCGVILVTGPCPRLMELEIALISRNISLSAHAIK